MSRARRLSLTSVVCILLGCSGAGPAPAGPTDPSLVTVEVSQAPPAAPAPALGVPTDGVYFGRTWLRTEQSCPGGADQVALVVLDVLVKLAVEGERFDAAVDADVTVLPESDCRPAGLEDRSLRAKFDGKVVARDGVLRLRVERESVAEVSPDGPLRGIDAPSVAGLTLECVLRAVEAVAHDPGDDASGLGWGSGPIPDAQALACRASKPLLHGALFDEWLDEGRLLLAPGDGIDRRIYRTQGGETHAMRILGAMGGHLPLWRQRIGAW